MEATGKTFVEFWAWVKEKGLMNANTAKAYAAPVRQIISIDEAWETQDVSALDVDSLLLRFRNKRGKDFKPDSLASYEQRFRKAYEIYMDYVSNPTTWKHKKPGNGKGVSKSTAGSQRKITTRQTDSVVEKASAISPSVIAAGTGGIDYPLPLRKDFVAVLRLPQDLTKSEVARLNSYMQIIARDDSEPVPSAATE